MQALRRQRTLAINIIVAMYAIDAATSIAALTRHEAFVAVNIIGILFDLVVIPALWSMKRWGAAFTIVASGKGMGQSFIILQLAILHGTNGTAEAAFWNWAEPLLVISTDIFIITYLFRAIFRGDFDPADPFADQDKKGQARVHLI
jgi:uncharacterized membrane protein